MKTLEINVLDVLLKLSSPITFDMLIYLQILQNKMELNFTHYNLLL